MVCSMKPFWASVARQVSRKAEPFSTSSVVKTTTRKINLSWSWSLWVLLLYAMKFADQIETSTYPPGHIWLFSAPGEWGIYCVRPPWGRGFRFCLAVVGKLYVFLLRKVYRVASVENSFPSWINISVYRQCTQALLQTTGTDDNFSLRRAFDRQVRRYGRVFEHHFGPRGREFKRSNLQNFKYPGFTQGRGGLKFRLIGA